MTQNEYNIFLNNLRESGKINMFAAPQVLREVYGLSRDESIKIWKIWINSFNKEEKK